MISDFVLFLDVNRYIFYKIPFQIIDFDALQKSTYSFTVTVRDPDPTHVDTASVVVTIYDVNDNAPVFSPANVSISISESVAVGTSVARFTATDKDSGNNGTFSYVEFCDEAHIRMINR